MTKKQFILVLTAIAFQQFFISNLSAELTEQSFQKDFSFYRKTSKNKNLTANDRLYILNKLREKYRDAEIDLTDLYAEIERQSEAKIEEKTAPKKTEPEKQKAVQNKREVYSKLTKILVSDNRKFSKVQMDVSELKQYKDILIKDDNNRQPPVLTLYLYNTQEQLKPIAKNFSIRNGIVKQIQSVLVEKNPPTTKVSISLRKDVAYQIAKTDRQLTVMFDKTAKPARAVPEVSASTANETADESSTVPQVPEPPSPSVPMTTEEYELEEIDESFSENIIQAGTVFKKQVFPTALLTEHVLVKPNGVATMLLTGDLKVSHMATAQLEGEIKKGLTRFIPKQNVAVTAQKLSPGQTFIFGEIKEPGIHNLKESITCSQLILKSGGFTENADQKAVTVHRRLKNKMKKIIINTEKIFSSGDSTLDILIEPGDIIEVPRLSNSILVLGAVQSPEWYAISEGLKLTQALTLAGGAKKNADTEQIVIIRTEQGKNITLLVNAKEILTSHPERDPQLKAKDVILVPEIVKSKSKLLSWRGTSWMIFIASLGVVLALAL